MRKETYDINKLKQFLTKNKIATMDELKTVLGTAVKMTVTRKLNALRYRSSYSHRGMYYALDDIIDFDSRGLWSFEPARFSKYGTLLETAKAFVNGSKAGLSVGELEELLLVEVKESALSLFRRGEVHRIKISGKYVYFARDARTQKRQILLREEQETKSVILPNALSGELLLHELKAAILLFFAMLDERQRRTYAGLESLKIGYGGDKRIADLLGIDPHTVAKGRSELLSQDFVPGKIRKKGGGRTATEKKIPKS